MKLKSPLEVDSFFWIRQICTERHTKNIGNEAQPPLTESSGYVENNYRLPHPRPSPKFTVKSPIERLDGHALVLLSCLGGVVKFIS